MEKFDVIIVGAGPSGIFCAYELIQKNKAQKGTPLKKMFLIKIITF